MRKIVVGLSILALGPQAGTQPLPLPEPPIAPRYPAGIPSNIKPRIDPLKHILAAGDVLEFTLDMHKNSAKGANVPTTYAIRADGMVELPVVGELKVAGLKLADAEKAISERLRKKLRNPKFRMGIASAAPVQVVVLGEVRQPGRYDIAPGSGVQEAVAVAGGYSALADKNSILVQDGATGRTTVAGAATSADSLKNGDVVYILAGKKINVLGEVFSPGQYALPSERPFPAEALLAAGGAKPTAALQRCVVFRPGTTQSFPVKLGSGPTLPAAIADPTAAINATVANPAVAPAPVNATAGNTTGLPAPGTATDLASTEQVKMVEGDILIVPPRQAVIINNTPKAVPLIGGENIMDIVTQGGISTDANLEDVRVMRNGGSTVEHVNIKKYLETQDRSVLVPINDGDVVVVETPKQGGSFISTMAAALLNPFTLLNLFTR